MAVVPFENVIYTLLTPVNEKYAPTMEKVRLITLTGFFSTRTARETVPFIRSRFDGDAIGIEDGTEVDFTEYSQVLMRLYDLINKTPLKCYFINAIEWYTDYPSTGTRELSYIYKLANSVRDLINKRALKEMTSMEIPKQTVEAILQYYNDTSSPINSVSGYSALVLLSCIASYGNVKLEPRNKRGSSQ